MFVALLQAADPIVTEFPPVVMASAVAAPIITFVDPEVIAFPVDNPPITTFETADVIEGKEVPRQRFVKEKSNVRVDPEPAKTGVELAVRILKFPAVGDNAPPLFPVRFVTVPVVGVAQVGTPAASVNT